MTIHFETFSNGMEMLKHRTARGITKAINFWLEIIPPTTELLKRCRQHWRLSICWNFGLVGEYWIRNKSKTSQEWLSHQVWYFVVVVIVCIRILLLLLSCAFVYCCCCYHVHLYIVVVVILGIWPRCPALQFSSQCGRRCSSGKRKQGETDQR